MPLSLTPHFCGNVYIIQCKGRIVAGEEAKALENALDIGIREFTRLVLHVGEVERLDSTGMGLLMRYAASTRNRGGDVRLAAPPPFLVTLLNVTRLSSVLQIYPAEEEAILSFLREPSAPQAQAKAGPKVLMLDQSTDLCAFVRIILAQNGYEVKSTSHLRDAKILLQVDQVDYILLGPETSQFSAQTVLGSLKTLAPKATAFQLDADFKCREAQDATEVLLGMFSGKSSAQGA